MERNNIPVIFLAFANDRDSSGGYLRNLPRELEGIRNALALARREGLCKVVERANATLENIFDVFQEYRERIAIFHYGGHADSFRLLLEQRDGRAEAAHSAGLSPFLAGQQGLQLIFLNGCCSQQQARELTAAGLPVVIGTSGKIADAVAADLAIRFYHGLGEGLALERCWANAEQQVLSRNGDGAARDLQLTREEALPDRFPWEIYYRPGAEIVKSWNLPGAAKNPLAGLKIPETYYRQLPAQPFIGLNYFRREDAGIFFGRGQAIYQLYQLLHGVHPIILFHGKSGVGKSSLLAAGLLPRIGESQAICYFRRDPEKGLSATLREALQAEAAVVNEFDLSAAWQAREATEGRPLIVILDQAEEVFTRPLPHEWEKPGEWEIFLADLITLFGPGARSPRGKLLLSYRKEYHPEINKGFAEARLSCAPFFLPQLDRAGIVEAIEGITRDERLRQRYPLTIEENSEGYLPGIIADDLLEDRDSPIAPMLQILLSNLWQQATLAGSSSTHFKIENYYQLRKQGLAMEDFLRQQFEKLRDWRAEVVDSGLLLDLLHYHTTNMETAGSRSRRAVEQAYAEKTDIKTLIEQCQGRYLLTEREDGEQISLAHDTLAPVIRQRYELSNQPGQRAARLLKARLRDSKADKKQEASLNRREIRIVEKGRAGMRAFSDEEKTLLKKSRRRQQRLQLAVFGIATVFVLLLWLGIDTIQQQRDDLAYKDALAALIDILEKEFYYESEKNPNGSRLGWFLTQADSFAVISTEWRKILPRNDQLIASLTDSVYWQRGGSLTAITYAEALEFIDQLNRENFAGYSDWRLPNWKEAILLIRRDSTFNGLYKNPLFDVRQERIWTIDQATKRRQWCLDFLRGQIRGVVTDDTLFFARAVRTESKIDGYSFRLDQLVSEMIMEKGFYNSDRNRGGKGINREEFPLQLQRGDSIVYDQATNLFWQRNGSDISLPFDAARAYVQNLNDTVYGGFQDWRLPTLEEALSLITTQDTSTYRHTSRLFDRLGWIWTSSQSGRGSRVWHVSFYDGKCGSSNLSSNIYVRAVRFGQSSP